MKKTGCMAATLLCILLGTTPLFSGEYHYQLFKNQENFGILVFPKEQLFGELEEFIHSLGFETVASGDAVMRFGSQRENMTYMMPESVQKKYAMKKFITLQVLRDRGILVGIYDPEFGLTLPTPIYNLEEIKKNLPKTLEVFRGGASGSKRIQWRPSSDATHAPTGHSGTFGGKPVSPRPFPQVHQERFTYADL